jgi:peptide/nickel transport system substrate-binding protein
MNRFEVRPAGCAPTRRNILQTLARGGAALGLSGWLRGNPALANPAVAVVAVTNTPPRADYAFADQFVESELIENIYDRLFEFKLNRRADGMLVMDGAGLEPVTPMLAESWQVSEDRRVYKLQLRKGVLSNFGNEFTAEDVRWSFERNAALGANGPFYFGAINFPGMDHFEVLDPYTVRITLSQPNVLFFKVLALPLLGIVDSLEGKKHTSANDPWATTWFKTNSAGFGPYSIAQWSPGEAVILTANPKYWQKPPAIKRVVMREIPDSANRLALLRNGDVDYAWNLTARERLSAAGDPAIKIYSVEPGQISSWLAMTATIAPFSIMKVRQAVCYAVPYDELVQTVTAGTGRRQMSPLPAPYEFYDATLSPYKTDLDRAHALLAEAGLAGGFKTSLGFSTAAPEDEETAVILKSVLSKAGIDVTLDKQPFAAFVEGWLGAKFPMSTMYAGAFVPDAAYALRLWFYSRNNVLAFTKWKNDHMDDLVEQLVRTFDQEERKKLSVEIQRIILDEAPMAFLIEPGIHYAVRADLKGIQYFTYAANLYSHWSKT